MVGEKKPAKTLPRVVVETRFAKKPRETRRALGARRDGEASFPAAPPESEIPSSYGETLRELKTRIQSARLRTVIAANASMIVLYWELGRIILARQEREGWGAKVIDRLSVDLREAFPDMAGLSPRNLKYMRAFAAAWSGAPIVQRVAAQIPWRQHQALLDKLDDQDLRVWYAKKTAEEGWSRDVLAIQIDRRLHEREGKAITNFKDALPPADSDMAAQVFKDPYRAPLVQVEGEGAGRVRAARRGRSNRRRQLGEGARRNAAQGVRGRAADRRAARGGADAPWEEDARHAMSARLEKEIRKNLRGLGYG